MQRQTRKTVANLDQNLKLRREIKADVKKQHNLYVNYLVGDVKAKPRDFYRYISSQKKDTQGILPLKRKNGKGVAQSDLEKAEEYNGQFTDVFNENEHTQVPLLDRSAPFMNDIAVSKDRVIKLLKGLMDLISDFYLTSLQLVLCRVAAVKRLPVHQP